MNVKYRYRGTSRTMGNRDDGTGDRTGTAEIGVGGVKAVMSGHVTRRHRLTPPTVAYLRQLKYTSPISAYIALSPPTPISAAQVRSPVPSSRLPLVLDVPLYRYLTFTSYLHQRLLFLHGLLCAAQEASGTTRPSLRSLCTVWDRRLT